MATQVAAGDQTMDQELASRWQRLGGAWLDGLIFLVIELPVMFMFGLFGQIWHGGGMTPGQTLGFFLFHLVVFAAINGWLLARHGQTVGMKVVGTRIVDLDGNLRPFSIVFSVRYALFNALANIPVAGSLFILLDVLFIFRKDKRCLHDLMAGTRVVRASQTLGPGTAGGATPAHLPPADEVEGGAAPTGTG